MAAVESIEQNRTVTRGDIVKAYDEAALAERARKDTAKEGLDSQKEAREAFEAKVEKTRGTSAKASVLVEAFDAWQEARTEAKTDNASAKAKAKDAKARLERLIAEARQPSLPFVE